MVWYVIYGNIWYLFEILFAKLENDNKEICKSSCIVQHESEKVCNPMTHTHVIFPKRLNIKQKY